MFNYNKIIKHTELRREELLKEADQERLIKELTGQSPGVGARFIGLVKRVFTSARDKRNSMPFAAKKSLQERES